MILGVREFLEPSPRVEGISLMSLDERCLGEALVGEVPEPSLQGHVLLSQGPFGLDNEIMWLCKGVGACRCERFSCSGHG